MPQLSAELKQQFLIQYLSLHHPTSQCHPTQFRRRVNQNRPTINPTSGRLETGTTRNRPVSARGAQRTIQLSPFCLFIYLSDGGKRKSSSICSPREKKSKTYSRAAQDTEVVMALLKRVLDESPTSIRNEIAAQFDVEARLLHMVSGFALLSSPRLVLPLTSNKSTAELGEYPEASIRPCKVFLSYLNICSKPPLSCTGKRFSRRQRLSCPRASEVGMADL